MDIKPIHNDTIYRDTLTEIEGLFDATPGTPEGDRLEVLVLPSDPVDTIKHGTA
ncbi:hypothetical protein [Armatimonas sp.]|uniref:hypothetical protein n=1 Tax=Armatimonas sp. TaxID=1872638 RepID=UPI003751D4D5